MITHSQIWSALHPTNSFRTVVTELRELGVYVADIIPACVIKDRTVTRGKNAGRRQVTYNAEYVLTATDIDSLFVALTGLPKAEYVAVRHFIRNEKGQTMFSLVFSDESASDDYVAHWFDVYTRTQHLRTKVHMHLMYDLDLTDYK